jgi:hypothetical protein
MSPWTLFLATEDTENTEKPKENYRVRETTVKEKIGHYH